ncbi:hypothetical protein L209DRAFT_383490 [Thermothelomyces heterothallicus CBS 203.75]
MDAIDGEGFLVQLGHTHDYSLFYGLGDSRTSPFLQLPHNERHGNETTRGLAWPGVSWRFGWVDGVFLSNGAGFRVTRMVGGHINGVYGCFWREAPFTAITRVFGLPALVMVGAWMEAKEKDTGGGFSFLAFVCSLCWEKRGLDCGKLGGGGGRRGNRERSRCHGMGDSVDGNGRQRRMGSSLRA